MQAGPGRKGYAFRHFSHARPAPQAAKSGAAEVKAAAAALAAGCPPLSPSTRARAASRLVSLLAAQAHASQAALRAAAKTRGKPVGGRAALVVVWDGASGKGVC